ncbi:MAG: transposase [Candidatus Omnitrophica bacterium]|nr:transposase [Candidatus Omnitrophota bacterium]
MRYENIYLKGYQAMSEAQEGLRDYFNFYHTERPHQSLGYKTPWQMHSGLEIIRFRGVEAQNLSSRH